jgi:hypothetical protein
VARRSPESVTVIVAQRQEKPVPPF